MHIEIFQSAKRPLPKQSWHWRTRNKGRVTGNNEAHDSRSKAMRAGKAVITAAIKELRKRYAMPLMPLFSAAPDPKRPGVTVIRWE